MNLRLNMQRLVAFLALTNRPQRRLFVAGTLWPDSTEDHAAGSLRTTLSRIHETGLALVGASKQSVWLEPAVSVDVHELQAAAERLVASRNGARFEAVDFRTFGGDLLPDWYDDWVLAERERLRQLRLHTLEWLCDRLSAAGRHGQAIQAGLAAVAGEPLRESAWRALIRAHLAEGNRNEALRCQRSFRRMLADELGAAPTAAFDRLFAP